MVMQTGIVIGAVVAAISVIIGIQILSQVNKSFVASVNQTTTPTAGYNLFDLVPLLLAAMVIIGIVVYFGYISGSR